jgi:pimeloyl-ACP methyl ester carboxylesterase
MAKRQLDDLIVLIPGILGSTLARDGRDIWGVSASALTGALLSLGKSARTLALEPDVDDSEGGDGVTAVGLLPGLGMLPTFIKTDGYSVVSDFLRNEFNLWPPTLDAPGNFIEFSYDWRLSNRVSARKLAKVAKDELDRWRIHTNNPAAKLVFICHSMGGLIALYFIEVLGGRDLTRMLITLGTPFRGSIKALKTLANGLTLPGLSLSAVVRSFPSVYELLPTYRCLSDEDNELKRVHEIAIPNVDQHKVARGLEFHEDIRLARISPIQYKVFPIKGIAQPTMQSARMRDGAIELAFEHMGEDLAGDGVVPRISSHPEDWEDDTAAFHASQHHSMLQSTTSVLQQIFGVLTAVRFSRYMSGGRSLSASIPDVVLSGDAIRVEVSSNDGDSRLPLQIACEGSHDVVLDAVPLTPVGSGRYIGQIADLPAGAYKLTVQSAIPTLPIEPVSDWTVIWPIQ